MHPIVSACGMAPYQLAKFLTKNPPEVHRDNPIICQGQQELQ